MAQTASSTQSTGDGKPIVRERVRWPIVEAMGTAYAPTPLTGDTSMKSGISRNGVILH